MAICARLPDFFEAGELLVEEVIKQLPRAGPTAAGAIAVFAEDVGLRTALFGWAGEMALLFFFRVMPVRSRIGDVGHLQACAFLLKVGPGEGIVERREVLLLFLGDERKIRRGLGTIGTIGGVHDMARAKVFPAIRTASPPHSLLVGLYIRKQGRLRIDHHLSEAAGRNTGEQVATVQAHGNLIERHEACAGDLVGNATRRGVIKEFDLCSRRGDFVFELRHVPWPYSILADILHSGGSERAGHRDAQIHIPDVSCCQAIRAHPDKGDQNWGSGRIGANPEIMHYESAPFLLQEAMGGEAGGGFSPAPPGFGALVPLPIGSFCEQTAKGGYRHDTLQILDSNRGLQGSFVT